MGILSEVAGKLFGTNAAVEKVIEVTASGLGKLHYSSQEKAEDKAADTTEARNMLVNWIANTQGQNLARRILALSVAAMWLSMYAAFIFCKVLSIFYTGKMVVTTTVVNNLPVDVTKSAIELAGDALLQGANDMNAPVMLVFAFYFAAPHMSSIIDIIFKKFAKGFTK